MLWGWFSVKENLLRNLRLVLEVQLQSASSRVLHLLEAFLLQHTWTKWLNHILSMQSSSSEDHQIFSFRSVEAETHPI